MTIITFSEYEKLPKRLINKTKEDLTPGKKYYIEDTKRKDKNLKVVYIGIFKHKSNGMNMFENVSYVVSPYGYTSGVPHGFDAKSGSNFFEVISRISDLSSSRSRSRSRSRSSSRSSTSKKGGKKHSKRRRTVKRYSKK
jgi:hypothetical protein|uniref:Uncharacterized protein n=1 Tax=viral metagenome TaxID=1070528 RepID=A0A6C0EEZ7_9ZZZZ